MTTELERAPRYTLKEAAKRIGVGCPKLAELIEADKVPGAYKAGRRYIIFAAPFDRWSGLAEPLPASTRNPFLVDIRERRGKAAS